LIFGRERENKQNFRSGLTTTETKSIRTKRFLCCEGINLDVLQGDRMSLKNNRPKCSQTHLWPKLLHNIYVRRKTVAQKLWILIPLKKTPKVNDGPIAKIRPIWSPWCATRYSTQATILPKCVSYII
jgi:hypothetical protein